jgi:hypothetical protein
MFVRAGRAALVTVAGDVMECQESVCFDYLGQPVVLRGREGGQRGSLVRAGHPFVKSHAYLFEPMKLDYDWPSEAALRPRLSLARPLRAR